MSRGFTTIFRFSLKKGALVSVVVVESEDARDFGTICLDDSQRIVRFEEKKEEENLLSMQVFIFSKRSFLSHTISCQIFPGARSFPYAC